VTCIVAVMETGRIVVAGDSQAGNTTRYSIMPRRDPKVFRLPAPTGGPTELVIGYTSSYRMGQLLRFGFTPPPHPAAKDAFAYLAQYFADTARTRFKEGGFAEVDRGVEKGGTFLVAYAGRIFGIFDNFQVAEFDLDYAAVGSGEELALGALHALSDSKKSAEDRARAAIAAAAAFNAYVGGPITVEILETAT